MKLTETKLRSIIREEISRVASSSREQIIETKMEDEMKILDYEEFKFMVEGSLYNDIYLTSESIEFDEVDSALIEEYIIEADHIFLNGKKQTKRKGIRKDFTVTNVLKKKAKGKFGSVNEIMIDTDIGQSFKVVNPKNYIVQTKFAGKYK